MRPVILINWVVQKNEYYYSKVFLENYYFNRDVEIYSNSSKYVESDEEYYDGKCIDLFLKQQEYMTNLFF